MQTAISLLAPPTKTRFPAADQTSNTTKDAEEHETDDHPEIKLPEIKRLTITNATFDQASAATPHLNYESRVENN